MLKVQGRCSNKNKNKNDHCVGELETLFCLLGKTAKVWSAIFLKKQRINPLDPKRHATIPTFPLLLLFLSTSILIFLSSIIYFFLKAVQFTLYKSNKDLSSRNTLKSNQAFCFKGN